MFDAVVVTLGVEPVANRAALVVRLKEHAPVHCSLTSSLCQHASTGDEEEEGGKRASAADGKGKEAAAASRHAAKKNKTL